MKKTVALFLTLILIVGVFVGCKDSEANLSSLTIEEIPTYDFGYAYVNDYEQDDRLVTKITDGGEEEFTGYLNMLLENGFKKLAENKIGDNQFIKLINKVTAVTMYYTPNQKAVRIIAEPRQKTTMLEEENKYKSKDIKTLFTGFKAENITDFSGLGFIIRLDDGSFLIIDGGAGDLDSISSTRLMNILKEQSPEGTKKPVIAAWIFTHAHSDHYNLFNSFSVDFHDKVIIEKFCYNFPPYEDIGYKENDSILSLAQFRRCMEEYYPEVPNVRPHTGDKFYIRNAVVEILFTYEDLFPKNYKDNSAGDLNNSSLIFKLEIEGQSMMITGDADNLALNTAYEIFGDYLKSDILQMSHHGQNGTVDFYKTVDPTYALLPMSHYDKARFEFNDANKWLVESENIRQFIEFSKYDVTFALPYNPKDSEISSRIPEWNTQYPTFPTLTIKTVKAADKVADAWFDLGFKDGKPFDKKGNLTVTMPKGSVGETTVNYADKQYNSVAFTADKKGEGLLIELPFKNEAEYKNWLMNGASFELSIQINKKSENTAALFGNANEGGAMLNYREAKGQLQLQFGTNKKTKVSNPFDGYAGAAERYAGMGPVYLQEKEFAHIVGTYDKKTNTLNIYYNGCLADSGSFGEGDFNLGKADFNTWGIAINPADAEDSFGITGDISVLGAKLYKTALSEAEVLKEYNDIITELTK